MLSGKKRARDTVYCTIQSMCGYFTGETIVTERLLVAEGQGWGEGLVYKKILGSWLGRCVVFYMCQCDANQSHVTGENLS